MSTTTVLHAVTSFPGSVVSYQLCVGSFDSDHLELLGQVHRVKVARDQTCPMQLTPNAELNPPGTWWVVTNPDYTRRLIVVPVSAVPVQLEDCLVDDPVAPGQVQVGVSEAELDAKLAGLGLNGRYVHTQSTAAAQWTITHNLGRVPVVQLLDAAGRVMDSDVQFPSAAVAVVTFAAPTLGSAVLT